MVGNIGYWIFINAHNRRDALFEKDLKETVDKKEEKDSRSKTNFLSREEDWRIILTGKRKILSFL